MTPEICRLSYTFLGVVGGRIYLWERKEGVAWMILGYGESKLINFLNGKASLIVFPSGGVEKFFGFGDVGDDLTNEIGETVSRVTSMRSN